MIQTIGHSNHPIGRFTALLRRHRIGTVADVRSIPYSRFHPQFRRERLQAALTAEGIGYVFLGGQLGARSLDPACHDAQGRVSYARLAATPAFVEGLERLSELMVQDRVALMCAERDPLDCHRTILIARELARRGMHISHILADGSLEAHDAAMQRLAQRLKLTATDLFRSDAELAEQACDLQAAHIAFRPGAKHSR
ncbi:MAG TPA: DUF488 domain-containing protein [Steroidobacteraceae bacterium]